MKTLLNSLLCVATVTALFSQIQVATAVPVPTNGPSLSSFANDDAFLEYIEKTTFQYFWNESGTNGLTKVSYNGTGQPAQPNVIGLALSSYNIAIERGWITRSNGAARVLATLRSLWNTPQGTNSTNNFIYSGYKGWFYQSLDADTGLRNGGTNNQLSSSGTATLMLGVIDSGLFFTNLTDQTESNIRTLSSNLVNRVEWDWLMDSDYRMLYGWAPETGFSSNGWGAGMQGYYIYLLGLGMPSNPLPPEAWTFWTSTYTWKNYYGYDYIYADGLFIHQHTHLWFDLRGITDACMWERGSDYFEDCRRATLVQQAYAIENPLHFANYGTNEWGLNESDSPHGYTVYGCPDALDEGVISPSAAASSMPMTPEISLPAIKNIYSKYSNLVWSTEGFMDCYAANTNCFTNFYFSTQVSGLQQGRILLMIENYRTGSTWNRMKTSPIIQRGLAQAGFFVPPTSAALPPPWTKADIGAANHLSGNSFYSNGVYAVTGAGAINLKDSDSFQYCSQPASRNCAIQALVTSIGDTNTSSTARAGVMIRETLATNSTHASMLFMPTSNGGGFYTRTSTGGNNSNQKVAGAPALPYWVKVTRSTNTFAGFVSANGTNWTQVGTQTINMTSNVYIGLVVSSSQDLVPCKTSFTNVTVSSGVANSAPSVSLTAPTNGAGFTAPASISLTATASDTDGTIASVSFYNSTNLMGTDTTSPYAYTWTNVSAGSYSLTARATDDDGAVSTSAVVAITVVNATCTLTASAGANGTISPTNATVLSGNSTNFVITASNYYRISTLTTNGVPVTGMSFDNNSTATNFTWSNVQTSGVLAATFTAQVTTNGSAQVPYSWLEQYGLTNYNTDATNDVDLDGLMAWQEYIAGTVPTNGTSCFKAAQNTRNVITWSSVSGRIYSVYWSTNLMKGFTNLNNNIFYPTNNYTNSTPDGRVNHYQIKVRMQ